MNIIEELHAAADLVSEIGDPEDGNIYLDALLHIRKLTTKQRTLQKLAARLADLLCEDQWAECEEMLIEAGVLPPDAFADLIASGGTVDAMQQGQAVRHEFSAGTEPRDGFVQLCSVCGHTAPHPLHIWPHEGA